MINDNIMVQDYWILLYTIYILNYMHVDVLKDEKFAIRFSPDQITNGKDKML